MSVCFRVMDSAKIAKADETVTVRSDGQSSFVSHMHTPVGSPADPPLGASGNGRQSSGARTSNRSSANTARRSRINQQGRSLTSQVPRVTGAYTNHHHNEMTITEDRLGRGEEDDLSQTGSAGSQNTSSVFGEETKRDDEGRLHLPPADEDGKCRCKWSGTVNLLCASFFASPRRREPT